MKVIDILLIFIFISSHCVIFSQTGHSYKIESEHQTELDQYDSALGKINNAIIAYKHEGKIDSSLLMISQKALILHKKGKSYKAIDLLDSIFSRNTTGIDDKTLLRLHLTKSEIHGQLFNTDQSESAIEVAYQYAETSNVSTPIDSEFLLSLAWIKMRRYKFSEALVDARKAYFGIIKHFDENHKKVNGHLQLVSYLHSQLKQLDSAEVYTQKYVENTEANGDFYRGLAYNQLGTLFMEMRKFEKAIKAHKQSERIGRLKSQEGDSRLLGVNCSNLSTTFSLCGESDLALNYAKESLKMHQESYGDNNIALRSPYTRLSDIYQSIAEYDSAVKYARLAYDIQINNEPDDLTSLAYTKNFLANALAKSGKNQKAKELSLIHI